MKNGERSDVSFKRALSVIADVKPGVPFRLDVNDTLVNDEITTVLELRCTVKTVAFCPKKTAVILACPISPVPYWFSVPGVPTERTLDTELKLNSELETMKDTVGVVEVRSTVALSVYVRVVTKVHAS